MKSAFKIRKYVQLWLCLLVFANILYLPSAYAGEVLDGIVAKVNGHIILQSDWEDEQRYEAFMNDRPLTQLMQADRKAALDHLIDQELLREQINPSESTSVSPEEIAKRLDEVRKQYAPSGDGSSWQAALARYQLTEDEIKNKIALELALNRLVDSRLRPSVQIDEKSIESYYNQEFLPQLRKAGNQDVPLPQVSPKIKEILTQRKVDDLLVAWLQDLRAGSDIRRDSASSEYQVR